MKKLITILFTLFSVSIITAQPWSATDSVIVTGSNSGNYVNNCRGFDFTPNVNVTITKLGKRVTSALGTYTWVIWNTSTMTAVHTQVSQDTLAGQYIYENISSPVTLNAGTQYSLSMYCDGSAGGTYYYGTSSQINSNLTYGRMRYCNSLLREHIQQIL